jgi:DNA-binding PadR family transcriptional regulator
VLPLQTVKTASLFLLNGALERRPGCIGVRFVGRLKDKVQRENLWFFILVLLSAEERYGFEQDQDEEPQVLPLDLINERFGFWSGNVTAYRVLYDLERARLVKAELRERRKYYGITELGRRELEEARTFLSDLLVESAGSRAE